MSNGFNTAMSVMAAAEASEASDQARRARQAAEEKLEGTTRFVVVNTLKLEETQQVREKSFFFPKYKRRFVPGNKITIKTTDISFVKEATDDFGTTKAKIITEDRSELDNLFVDDSLESLTRKLNDIGGKNE